jgi:hypothetical protein
VYIKRRVFYCSRELCQSGLHVGIEKLPPPAHFGNGMLEALRLPEGVIPGYGEEMARYILEVYQVRGF